METTQKKQPLLKHQIRRLGNRNLFYHRRAYFSLLCWEIPPTL